MFKILKSRLKYEQAPQITALRTSTPLDVPELRNIIYTELLSAFHYTTVARCTSLNGISQVRNQMMVSPVSAPQFPNHEEYQTTPPPLEQVNRKAHRDILNLSAACSLIRAELLPLYFQKLEKDVEFHIDEFDLFCLASRKYAITTHMRMIFIGISTTPSLPLVHTSSFYKDIVRSHRALFHASRSHLSNALKHKARNIIGRVKATWFHRAYIGSNGPGRYELDVALWTSIAKYMHPEAVVEIRSLSPGNGIEYANTFHYKEKLISMGCWI
ncbi:hypothetical protein EJ08DRAFT_695295 [Tothia fuscella]|uniref:Uncharacterized protein n=1 Tax=Tothia fuscella TaxID=1048955 RepID=A0A9P4U132_9PEZI|nr:hypothetical protein EJ08DRAFT_695295 [Tothia fuscella]